MEQKEENYQKRNVKETQKKSKLKSSKEAVSKKQQKENKYRYKI